MTIASQYSADFFNEHVSGAVKSARSIVPIVTHYTEPRSVLDIGCGYGAWLKVFQEVGVVDVTGIDGQYVDQKQLLISPSQFHASDLNTLATLPRKADLVLCLEVLEHLSDSAGRRLVSLMTQHTDFVLFSAAIPNQGGTGHVNEQWHDYWHRRFSSHGFSVIDCIRPHILTNRAVEYWYRQNIFLYANDAGLAKCSQLRLAANQPADELVPIKRAVLSQMTYPSGLAFELFSSIKRRILRGR